MYQRAYTHYTHTGAARLDRIYISEDLSCNKQGAETIAAAFTDHLAVLIRIKLATTMLLRGKGRRCMNTSLLKDMSFQRKFRNSWREWAEHIKRYPDILHWWVHYVKNKIKILNTREGAESNADRRRLEEYYYTVIYDIVREPVKHSDKMMKLKSLKAKIVRLNIMYRHRVMLNTAEHDRIDGETPTLHHLLKNRKRQENRMINKIGDDNGVTQENSLAILKAFSTHFLNAFQTIDVEEGCTNSMLQCNIRPIPPEINSTLIEPITEDEIRKAISQGKPHKAPGADGKGLEFYRSELKTIRNELTHIMNCMFTDDPIMAQQVKGLVCIPKKPHPECIDVRPLTLLNADYKILTRIIANRMKPILHGLIHPQQHCGSLGTSVFEAVATIRDAIAHSEITHNPLCVIAIHFQSAFDRV